MGYLYAAMIGIIGFYIWMFLKPESNHNARTELIRNHVTEIGGSVLDIKKMKRSECPYNEELGLNQDVVYIPYKVDYLLDGKEIEGWAILVIEGMFLVTAVLTDDKWILKL